MQMVNRITKEETRCVPNSGLKILYNNFIGRLILKLFITKFMANIVKKCAMSKISLIRVHKIIDKCHIDMSIYEEKEYKSFNDFFLRRKKDLSVDLNPSSFISPCDSKLLVYKLDNESKFEIKGSTYAYNEIINNDKVEDYKNGYVLVFRLEESDYHHYCFPDDGTRSEYNYINGKLHTVHPIAFTKYKVFHQNCREWCILNTKNFDELVFVEVGAMNIGKICNEDIKKFKRGEEKGHFEFGGSTIIVFVKDNIVDIDEDIVENSKNGKETIVHYGEKIGKKKINN